jgi:hypothetical protein
MRNTHLEKVAVKKQKSLGRMLCVIILLSITVFASPGLLRAQYETPTGPNITGEATHDHSGKAVSLSADGSIVAVGDPWYGHDEFFSAPGHVQVYQYQYSGSGWVQLGADIEGESDGDFSGWSVSLSADGSIVAIGASDLHGYGERAGYVRVYQYASGAWVQLGADIDGEAAGDSFGFSVSLSADGSIVAVGAPFNDGVDSDAGHVRVYQYLGGAWV